MDMMQAEFTSPNGPGLCSVTCHHGGDSPGSIIPTTAPEFLTFVTTQTVTQCRGYKWVEPGDPDKSALALALDSKCDDNAMFKMPPQDYGATPEQIEGVRSWIKAGAKP
jgi:hypothetical protein